MARLQCGSKIGVAVTEQQHQTSALCSFRTAGLNNSDQHGRIGESKTPTPSGEDPATANPSASNRVLPDYGFGRGGESR